MVGGVSWSPTSPRGENQRPNGFLVPAGRPRRMRPLDLRGMLVVGEDGDRCVVLSSPDHEDLHRALVIGAENLRLTSARTGTTPFSPGDVTEEIGRHLPSGYRMGTSRAVWLSDVHGTGRILFAALIGGRPLDDELDCARTSPPPPGGKSGWSLGLADLPTMDV